MPEIENIKITPYYNNEGILRAYKIEAESGYLLHFSDPEAETEDSLEQSLAKSSVTVGYNYDFDNRQDGEVVLENGDLIAVKMVGKFRIYAIKESLV